LRVSQRSRIEPVSLMKASVCIDPRPDHEPSGRQATAGSPAGGGALRHDADSSAASISRRIAELGNI
jgi:hypothetical protein